MKTAPSFPSGKVQQCGKTKIEKEGKKKKKKIKILIEEEPGMQELKMWKQKYYTILQNCSMLQNRLVTAVPCCVPKRDLDGKQYN